MGLPPALAICLVGTLAVAGVARAESELRLPLPVQTGRIAADTLDEQGRRIGRSAIEIDARPDGAVFLLSESHIDGGGGNRLSAELAPAGDGTHLVPVLEESRSDLASGRGLGFLRIDHRRGRMRCESADGEAEELVLPSRDRVAIAAMNLLFLPLVRGEEREVRFQIPLCRGGPRLVDARAERAPAGSDRRLVEIRTVLDFGPVLGAVVKPFLPRFSLWFDGTGAGDWIAHRMPLYSRGPTVVVARTGVEPSALGLEGERP